MYLKNIEVQGFKSFAQKINFEFHNGITGIVGPNGSGKSNVADAVRWVLGEQSARQLRGGSMQDVIFSGTQARKPLSFACVAITLDNSDHALAVAFEEVTITRRLYRSGESEYLINGSACRLKDINEMFYDTGIGKEGYSIIGQGQIDRILSGKPEERRELFDEAAGIVKFKRRKNSAVKKLADEQGNLLRLADILTELERQLKPLEKQAQTARTYLSRRQRQQELDVGVFLAENESAGKTLEELSARLKTAQDEMKEVSGKYEKTREESARLEEKLKELESRLDNLRSEAQEYAIRQQQINGTVGILKEQIQSALQNEEIYQGRLGQVEKDITARSSAIDQLSSTGEELKEKLRKSTQVRGEQEKKLSDVQARIRDGERAVEEGKNEIIELLNARATTKGKGQRFDTLLEQIEIRKARLSQRILTVRSEELERKKGLGEAENKLREANEKIRGKLEERETISGKIDLLTERIRKQTDEIETGQAAFHRESSRLESLRNMAERYEGYGNSIRRVMECREKVPGLHGVVADLIKVRKDYEAAVEIALGGSIQNIVTDNEETAKRMVEFLKKNRYGRATFLPLDSLTIRGDFQHKEALREPGVIGLASTLVQTQSDYRILADYLLGRILVVDEINHAITIARKYHHSLRIVTLEGESLSPGGSITGGAFRNSSNLLGRKREIEELQLSIQALQEDLEKSRQSVGQSRDERTRLRDTHTALGEELRELYVEQNTIEIEVKAFEEKGREAEQQVYSIAKEQEEIRKESAEALEEKEKIQEELKASSRDEKELEEYIQSAQLALDADRQLEKELSGALEQLRMSEASVSQEVSFAKQNLSRVQGELDDFLAEKEGLKESLVKGEEDRNSKEAKIREYGGILTELARSEEETRKTLAGLQEEKESESALHKSFFEERDSLSSRIGLLDKEIFRLNTQKEKLDEAQEARISYLWEEYQITPNMARENLQKASGDVREMKKELGRVKEEIRALGPVNVNAIEEYKELSERHGFLSAQYQDLKEAEENLLKVIRELDEGMRKQFKEKFQEIQREFDKTFKELFGGGKGTLDLEQDADILEAGITIVSQPPGKKLQNMMQLSGGEKALTAIALLFAIQNLKPSPFCLLDEIEAALDDSNVGRFAGYLSKLTKHTQFIVITHRRGTMTAADRLYGITMQEKGVSTLVSVDLVESQLS